jgi:3'-5' exonuclease
MREHLVFDIETIPQEASQLTDKQKDTIADKLERSDYWKKDRRKEMALHPWFGRIISIGLFYPERDKAFHITDESELKILNRFWEAIGPFRGTFVSYNGLNFDVPFIKTRSMLLGALPTNQNFLETRRYQSHPHYDAAQHLSDWDFRYRVSLDLACDQLGIPSPKKGEVEASTVYDAYKAGKLDLIGEYCVKDLMATMEVYNKVRRYRI